MAIQTFVASTVLTAAQMNALQANDYNQTVSTKTTSYTLVAADKGTRVVMNSASATTITVNTSLFSAGDTLILQNISTGVCTVTAGTATVSTAGSLAIPQNGSGILYFTSAGVSIFYPSAGAQVASGLTLVKAQTVGTGVATVQVTGAFSSTYDNYKIWYNGGVCSGGSFINMILGATTTGYYFNNISATFAGGAVSNSAVANSSNFPRMGQATTTHCQANFELNGPNLTDETTLYGWFVQSETGGQSGAIGGVLVDNTQYTSFTFGLSFGATFTGGTIYVYGYAKS